MSKKITKMQIMEDDLSILGTEERPISLNTGKYYKAKNNSWYRIDQFYHRMGIDDELDLTDPAERMLVRDLEKYKNDPSLMPDDIKELNGIFAPPAIAQQTTTPPQGASLPDEKTKRIIQLQQYLNQIYGLSLTTNGKIDQATAMAYKKAKEENKLQESKNYSDIDQMAYLIKIINEGNGTISPPILTPEDEMELVAELPPVPAHAPAPPAAMPIPAGGTVPSGARVPSSQFRMPSDDVWMPDEPSKVSNDWSVPDSEFTKNYPRTLPSGSVKPKTSQQAKRTPSATPVAKKSTTPVKAAPKPQKPSSGLSKSDQTFRQQAADSAAKWRAQAKQATPGSALQKQLQKNAEIADKEALGLKEKVASLKKTIAEATQSEIDKMRAQRAEYQKAAEDANAMLYNPAYPYGTASFRKQRDENLAKVAELNAAIARASRLPGPVTSQGGPSSGAPTPNAVPPAAQRTAPTPNMGPSNMAPMPTQGAVPANQNNSNFTLQNPILPTAQSHQSLNVPQSNLNLNLGGNAQQPAAMIGNNLGNKSTQPAAPVKPTTKSAQHATKSQSKTTQTTKPTQGSKSTATPPQGAPVIDKSTWPSRTQTTTPPAKQSNWGDFYGGFTPMGESTTYSDNQILTRIIGLAGIK